MDLIILFTAACLVGLTSNTNAIVFGMIWPGLKTMFYNTQDQGSKPCSTTLETSMLTITLLMWFKSGITLTWIYIKVIDYSSLFIQYYF
jgi:hypothetical protein